LAGKQILAFFSGSALELKHGFAWVKMGNGTYNYEGIVQVVEADVPL
jgi:hypothetical protein